MLSCTEGNISGKSQTRNWNCEATVQIHVYVRMSFCQMQDISSRIQLRTRSLELHEMRHILAVRPKCSRSAAWLLKPVTPVPFLFLCDVDSDLPCPSHDTMSWLEPNGIEWRGNNRQIEVVMSEGIGCGRLLRKRYDKIDGISCYSYDWTNSTFQPEKLLRETEITHTNIRQELKSSLGGVSSKTGKGGSDSTIQVGLICHIKSDHDFRLQNDHSEMGYQISLCYSVSERFTCQLRGVQ
jgi:hypothetical protein